MPIHVDSKLNVVSRIHTSIHGKILSKETGIAFLLYIMIHRSEEEVDGEI